MNADSLTKDDLVGVIEDLQGRLDDVETRLDLATKKRDSLEDRIWSLEDELAAAHQRTDQLEARVDSLEDDLGARQREKRGKHASVIRHAHNVKGSRPGHVVKPPEAAAAAECSERHAYEMVEDMAEAYDFCALQRKPKAVRVSFENHDLDAALGIVQGKSDDGGD